MSSDRSQTRRTLLAAVGAGIGTAITAGSAGAVTDRDADTDGDPPRGGSADAHGVGEFASRVPRTVEDNDVTFLFDTCSRFRVMGDLRAAETVRVHVVYYLDGRYATELFWYDDPGWYFDRDVRTEFEDPGEPVIANEVTVLDADWNELGFASNPHRPACEP